MRPESTLGTVFLFLHGACVGLSRIRTTCHHPTGYHHHPAGLILGGRERLHAVTFTIHHRSRSMDRRGVGGTHTALIFSTSSSLLYSFFKGEAAAAVSSSSSSHLPFLVVIALLIAIKISSLHSGFNYRTLHHSLSLSLLGKLGIPRMNQGLFLHIPSLGEYHFFMIFTLNRRCE